MGKPSLEVGDQLQSISLGTPSRVGVPTLPASAHEAVRPFLLRHKALLDGHKLFPKKLA